MRAETRAGWRWWRTALVGVACVALSSACASVPSVLKGAASDPVAARPEAPPEYDLLVAELAALDGEFLESRDALLRAVEKDPDSAYLHGRLSRLSAQMNDLESAVKHARRAVELEPDNPDLRLFLARLLRIRRDVAGVESALLDPDGKPIGASASLLLCQMYLEVGRLDEALALAEQLVRDNPDMLSSHMTLATTYEQLGRAEDATRVLNEALEDHPENLMLYSRLARMYRRSGDRVKEIELYDRLLMSMPHHYGSLVSMADAQIAVNDLDAAIQTYEEIVAYYPEDVRALRRLASLEYTAGRYEQAVTRLEEAMLRNPSRLELSYSIGQVRQSMGDNAAAIEAFERVTAEHPLYVEARLQIASILEEREDFDAALIEVEKIRELRPSRALDFHTAELRARVGDFEGGVALLEERLAASPDDDEVLYQLGALYGTHKQVERALYYMRESLSRNADNAHALNYIGYTLAERSESLEEAEAMILRALEQRPEDGYITDSLGWVYYMKARVLMGTGHQDDGLVLLERARDQLLLAVELTGGDPVVAEHLGDVHMLLDQKGRALEFYEEAVELEYRKDEQPELIEKLERLRQELDGK
jgi:tetratricopeptide (TPR) repeat protein